MRYRSHLFALLLVALTAHAQAADWKACEQAKLRQLKLEQNTRGQPSGKSKHSKKSGGHTNAANLDEWLWKNCRSYANELRSLEQSRM